MVSVTHAKVTAKAAGGDGSLVQPTDWNAAHTITCSTGVVLGRASASTGAVEEIPCTAQARSFLAAVDMAALVAAGFSFPSTGDFKFTLKTVADATWIMCDDGTIGNAASGASSRANADTATLFALLWSIPVAYTPIFNSDGSVTTRGANAAADYAANKRIALTKMLGRALAVAGTGSGLSAWALGQTVGVESVVLDATMIPGHTHTFSGTTGAAGAWSLGIQVVANTGGSGANVSTGGATYGMTGISAPDHTHAFSGTTASTGGGLAHTNLGPRSFVNCMVKL